MIERGHLILWLAVATFAAICLVILVLLARVMLRRNAAGSVSRASLRRTPPEMLWMLAPVILFAMIAVPSLRLLYFHNATPAADLTVRMTGKMWFWTFQYSGNGDFSFVAPMLSNAVAETPGSLNSPSADDHIVVPVGKTVRLVAASTNVIYSLSIPSLRTKIGALPGQVDETWFRAKTEGRYYGQCSELCGLPHAFRPLEIEVVSQQRFNQWAAEARERFTPANVQVEKLMVQKP